MLTFPIWQIRDGACACPRGSDCNSPGKHPKTRNGVKDAREGCPLEPGNNVGVACGKESGIIVVDLDIKPGKNGIESLKALGRVPRTYTVKTGSGGYHLYFKYVPCSNSVGKVGPGIDVRSDGGYVVAPPSNHISGGLYELVDGREPADLPEWLLERIQAVAAAREHTADADRGYFPAASPAVLEAAREALKDHGPAIQGDGGDLHTFRAGAILTHDLALTDEEAWGPFLEWNETCHPPWSESDLRSKLNGGSKYGSAEYGCRRTMDVVETARRMIRTWQESGTGQPGAFELVARVRTLTVDDKTKRQAILQELASAIGLPATSLDLPPVRVAPIKLKRGEILMTTELAEISDQALISITPHVFARAGVLCEVVSPDRTFISDLSQARIQDLMSRSSKYVRVDPKAGSVSIAAPDSVARILESRRIHPKVRILEAITNAPIFLADGTVLQEKGYNEQARVYLDPDVDVDVPDKPTKQDARESILAFKDLLCDFHFAEPADFSSWLAALLSPLVKAATKNAPSPLFCVSASNAGSGKTLLSGLIAKIITGKSAEIRPYNPKDPGEWGKRLTSFVKAASPVSVFDNIPIGPFGDESLDRLVTSSTWSDRILGASDAPPLPNVTTWIATGNNIEPYGDTVRRCLMIKIEVDDERPQERQNFTRPLLEKHAADNRGLYLSHALTILRAFHVAGRPEPKNPLQAWGSFTEWSDLVRGSLSWTGLADPFLTQRRAEAELTESDTEAHDFWIRVIDQSNGTPGSLVEVCNRNNAQDALILRDSVTPHNLRKLIRRFVDRPRGAIRIRRRDGNYVLQAITKSGNSS